MAARDEQRGAEDRGDHIHGVSRRSTRDLAEGNPCRTWPRSLRVPPPGSRPEPEFADEGHWGDGYWLSTFWQTCISPRDVDEIPGCRWERSRVEQSPINGEPFPNMIRVVYRIVNE